MKITPIHHGLTLGLNAPGYVRTPGLHMSDLYNDLFKALEPKRFDTGSPMDLLKLELGMALEETIEDSLRKRLVGERPGEFTTEEGIIYSPDFIMFAERLRLGEIKLTWMSSKEVPREAMNGNGFPPKFDKWLCQIKCYCYHLETPYARLLACFVNGMWDWKKGMSPELLGWDFEFTKRELDENWSMVRNHGTARGLLVL